MAAQTCVRENLQRFLEGKIPIGKEASWHDHLESCLQCRSRLEEMAGGELWWKEAKDFLALGAADVPFPANAACRALKDDHSEENRAELERAELTSEAISLGFLTPTDDPESLGRLGAYEIIGVIGQGGSGIVLKAFDRSLNRNVAIKVLAPHLAASGAARKRFAREAQAAAAVAHEHVVPIFAVTLQQNLPYIVMQYFPGQSLQHRLDRDGPLELKEVLRIGLQTARGLAAAHAQGLIHRDVKPANILLADGIERISLSDFGLARALDDARLTRTGWLAGTPEYMSPEQSRGKAMDARSDLFSLGSVLYAACTGRVPFQAETSYGTLRLVSDEEPLPIRRFNSDVPEWLSTLIGKLMAKDPDDRFGSAAEVAGLLEACLAHVQQPDTARLPQALVAMKMRSRFVGAQGGRVLAGIVVGLLGFFLGWIALWQGMGPPDIAGHWTGDDGMNVQLKHVGSGAYEGGYSATKGNQAGQVQLTWSQTKQRFTGTWREGDDRFGELSLRVKDKEIHGALTVDPKSKIDPAKPVLTDLKWVKGETREPMTSQNIQGEKGPTSHAELEVQSKLSTHSEASKGAMVEGLAGSWIPTLYADGLFHIRESNPEFPPPPWEFGDVGSNSILFYLFQPTQARFEVIESKNPVLIRLTFPNRLNQYFRIKIQKEKLTICAHRTIPPAFAAPAEGCEYWELKPFLGDVENPKRSIQFAYRLDQPPSSEVWPPINKHTFPFAPLPKIPGPKLVYTSLGADSAAKETQPLLRSTEKQSWKVLKQGTRSQISWAYQGRTIFKDRPDEETYEFTGSDFSTEARIQNWSKSVAFHGKPVTVMETPNYSLTIEPSDQPPYPAATGRSFPQIQSMLSKIATLPSGKWSTFDPESGRILETLVHGQRAETTHWTATKRRPSVKAYDFERLIRLDISHPKKIASFHSINMADRKSVDARCGFFDIENSPVNFEKIEVVHGVPCDLFRLYNTGNTKFDFSSGLVWIDKVRSLPVKAEWFRDDGTHEPTTFDWDSPIGDLTHSMKTPEGFSVKNDELFVKAYYVKPRGSANGASSSSKRPPDKSAPINP